jgi:desulfoferrodoxin (superoxide reductase-like protein)
MLTTLRTFESIFVIVLLIFFLVPTVQADVPKVQQVSVTIEAGNNIINLEILHNSPSSSHYIDIIEIEINERLDRVNLTSQTSTVFTYKHDIGDAQSENIRVRVHCNNHGWSSWKTLDEEQTGTSFFESPLGLSLVTGGIIAVVAIILIFRRKS